MLSNMKNLLKIKNFNKPLFNLNKRFIGTSINKLLKIKKMLFMNMTAQKSK